MYIVYILLSEKDPNRYYIGFTQDLEKRLSDHNQGRSGYSGRYAPWRIETYVVFNNERTAREFEKYLKAGSGNAFLKRHLI